MEQLSLLPCIIYPPGNLLEAISKKGFWFKIAAGPSFKPEEYLSILRI
jgi:hypothetical protein